MQGVEKILSAPRFSQVVVAETGHMAVMNTMDRLTFVAIKRTIKTPRVATQRNTSRARYRPVWWSDWCGRICRTISGRAWKKVRKRAPASVGRRIAFVKGKMGDLTPTSTKVP